MDAHLERAFIYLFILYTAVRLITRGWGNTKYNKNCNQTATKKTLKVHVEEDLDFKAEIASAPHYFERDLKVDSSGFSYTF